MNKILVIGFVSILAAFILANAGSTTLAAPSAIINVNSVSDNPDVFPGNGVCETVTNNGVCTLRAAIQEANALAGTDTIILQANTTYILTRPGIDNNALNGDLDIMQNVSIIGAGAGSTIVDGNGSGTNERVFDIPFSNASVIIANMTITNGEAFLVLGGGINNVGKLTLNNVIISSNTSPSNTGGGIWNSGALTLTNSTVSGNTAYYAAGLGNSGSMTVINSTISGNTAFNSGGGVSNSGALTLLNSTISGNHSNQEGGGLYAISGSVDLFNITIASNIADYDHNDATDGGGIKQVGGTVTLRNSLLAYNAQVNFLTFPIQVADDCKGTLTSASYNLVEYTTGCTVGGSATDLITGTDPLLGLLQDNGGSTQTRALKAGSVAIDAGNPGGCTDSVGATLTTDQRGRGRSVDGDGNSIARCDLGAYERQLSVFQPLVRK